MFGEDGGMVILSEDHVKERNVMASQVKKGDDELELFIMNLCFRIENKVGNEVRVFECALDRKHWRKVREKALGVASRAVDIAVERYGDILKYDISATITDEVMKGRPKVNEG